MGDGDDDVDTVMESSVDPTTCMSGRDPTTCMSGRSIDKSRRTAEIIREKG